MSEKKQMVADPEVKAMARIHKILSELSPEAQRRIVVWMQARVMQQFQPAPEGQ